jgi:hypothetical protein
MITSLRSMTFFNSRAKARTEESRIVSAASSGSAEMKLSVTEMGALMSWSGTLDASALMELGPVRDGPAWAFYYPGSVVSNLNERGHTLLFLCFESSSAC